MNENIAIEVSGLTKSYPAVRVLDGIDLSVPAGNVFALLGPNGAGKTTTVRILATLLTPDGGSARVAGHDVVAERHAVRRRISLTGQYAAVDEGQTGRENLEMMGRLRGLRPSAARARATDLLDRFDLVEAGDRRVTGYSGGMRRRLDLAAGLVADPEVIFLDEPTTGLDPRARRAMWEVVTGLADAGVTVFLTTQYLDEAESLADTIAVLDGGRIVASGTASELKQRVGGARLELRLADAASFDELIGHLGPRAVHADRATLTIATATDDSAPAVRELLDELDPGGIGIVRFALRTATLDDAFMTLTGDGARADPATGDHARADPATGDHAHAETPESETANV
jgi:ABC-2 type transport system ATP-binding protein